MIVPFFLTLVGFTTSQICPPPEVLHPCLCEAAEIICQDIGGKVNLKEIFDNASAYVNDDIVFQRLEISQTTLFEIEADTIKYLKFNDVYIQNNPNLTYISPYAFDESRSITTLLSLSLNQLENMCHHIERDIFEFVTSFKNLQILDLVDNSISIIPENSFQGMNFLLQISISANTISQIESRAFSGAPRLAILELSQNSIPSDGLSEDAFQFHDSTNRLTVDLSCNGIEYLEQKSYQPLLDRAIRVTIGASYCPDKPQGETFYCDERVAWICKNVNKYRRILTGYTCEPESTFKDIWEYCRIAYDVCPPSEVLLPCTCKVDATGKSISCSDIQYSFNLKEIFDKASVYINPEVIFDVLYIQETLLVEIEESAIQHFKFRIIQIDGNPKLTYVSPLAFNATRNITTHLTFQTNSIENSSPFERDIFDVIGSLKMISQLLAWNNNISSVPDNAFQNLNSPWTRDIYLNDNQISSIGSRAFAGPPNLRNLHLTCNNIHPEEIANDAFHGISRFAKVELKYNMIDHLEQKIFQSLLDTVSEVHVGVLENSNYCHGRDYYDRLQCDERADWICENENSYKNKLIGFRCSTDSNYQDIWEYCESRNSTALVPST